MPHTPSKAAEAAFDDSFSLTRGIIMVRAREDGLRGDKIQLIAFD